MNLELNTPPILPSLGELMEKYYLNPENLPIHDFRHQRNFVPKNGKPLKLFCPSFNPTVSRLTVTRDSASGAITGIKESFHVSSGSTAKNSFSLRRIPGPPEELVQGSSTNYPFWPGGISKPHMKDLELNSCDLFNPEHFLQKHPLLLEDIEFNQTNDCNEDFTRSFEMLECLDVSKILQMDGIILDTLQKIPEKDLPACDTSNKTNVVLFDDLQLTEQVQMLNMNVIELHRNSCQISNKETEWAEVINTAVPIEDFCSRLPSPACSYPFELDTFQKQAILLMESKESVFVAAHTSAGKTVVAEYAIALSLKHMTRSFYTSPIKALSNQKYHDLKLKFEDVGLLTGDIQINTKASCLIMTTEILQSMLYNGSDLIRDLEWVIFDEVHYINNTERGHVWEEVLIMLPSHINIVLLSATVPNTLEFADWIGRIKKKKIFVISTSKRPVPLEHFLYTGSGGRTKDERFLLVDATGKMINSGYHNALAAKDERKKKSCQNQGPKNRQRQQLGDNQEKTMWIGLVDHLKESDLLPTVAFTLSKNRCNVNASLLESQDLTTAREKGEIHAFIKKCTDRLQGTDKKLPQVVEMTTLLKKGIGVHHSGILPILKEVVEMLFSKGLVKLLFATETFAMGVNMPARSVVFDSIRKHDGINFRDLLPSEYIQMAGRAGRRGIDTIGTVIILCKVDVPELSDLSKMMLGKPTKLESQFKLTYSMILNLLRIEALRVEDMMQRSFSESFQLANHSKFEEELAATEIELSEQPELQCATCVGIHDFYALSKDYIQDRSRTYQEVYKLTNARKILLPGRVICMSYKHYQNYIGCIIKLHKDPSKLYVFVLKDIDMIGSMEESINECLAIRRESYCTVAPTTDHEVLLISLGNIIRISKSFIKIDGEKIMDNVQKRLIHRFKDDPASKSVHDLIMKLQRMYEADNENLQWLDFVKDLSLRDFDCSEDLIKLRDLESRIQQLPCLECPQFDEHFGASYKKLQLQEKVGHLKYLVSEESMVLHPEYQVRIKVLKHLKYVEDNNIVTLKGRVACEMGNHELMVTELLLENVLAEKPIEEVCALLSSLVFQQRNCSEPNLPEELKIGITHFKEVARKIAETQRYCGLVESVEDFVDQFNFGLAEVVYQWVKGMSFTSLMDLTNVQEGITVKAIQRLDESLRDVRNAARIIGDPALFEKMEQASTCIKRDIVFAASLYTQ